MKKCSHCGEENRDDFNICLNCGRQLPPSSSFNLNTTLSTGVSVSTGSESLEVPPGGKVAPSDCTRPDCPKVFPPGYVFCGQCGRSLQDPPRQSLGGEDLSKHTFDNFAGSTSSGQADSARPNKVKLVLLRPDGSEGDSYTLSGERIQLGREKGKILFLDDDYISPLHATFIFENGRLYLQNENSLNGFFIRLKEPVELKSGDVMLMGKQLLRFEILDIEEDEELDVRGDHPARPWGSPYGPYWGRLVQLISGGFEGNCILLGSSKIDLGRERGEITFPGDRFISSLHARIYIEDGKTFLRDLKSRNGTFIQIKDRIELQNEDIMIIGEQLLKVKFQ